VTRSKAGVKQSLKRRKPKRGSGGVSLNRGTDATDSPGEQGLEVGLRVRRLARGGGLAVTARRQSGGDELQRLLARETP